MTAKLELFKNDTQSLSFGPDNSFTLENGTKEVLIYGDLTISKDTAIEDIDSIIEVFNNIKESLLKKPIKKPIK